MDEFSFDVDEEWAKEHNEMLRDTRYLLISGIVLFVVCLAAAVAIWFFVDPSSPWRLLGSLSLGFFGVIMLGVGIAVPKSAGSAQSIYQSHPLAPAIIADHPGTRTTLLALVNLAVDGSTPRCALTAHDVQDLPHTEKSIGSKVPVAAVGGQRNVAEKNVWQIITPMPIAWGTASKSVVSEAARAIPDEQWSLLRKNATRLDDVKKAKNKLLPL